MKTRKEARFELNRAINIRASDIQSAAQEALEQARMPGTVAHANALANELDPGALPENIRDALKVRSEGVGVGTVDAIAVLYMSKAGWDLWKHVVLPHLRARWGDRAIVAKERERAAASAAKRVAAKGKAVGRKKSAAKKAKKAKKKKRG